MTSFLDRPHPAGTGRVAYTLRGDGPLVVTVPGMGDLAASDTELAEALAADGFRVASLELRGHGASDTGFAELGDAATASDIAALIEVLGGPAIVVGTSMGASSAIVAAADRPELVSGLVLLSPFTRNASGSPTLMRALFRVLFARPWGTAVWTGYFRRALNKGTAPAALDAQVSAIRTSLRRPGRLAEFRRLALVLDHAIAEQRVPAVTAPTLAVIGAVDPDFRDPAAELAHVARVLGARTLLVEDAAHYPHRQRPELVLPVVRGFVGEIARTARA
ncbi:alpha/beta fold hydrolase [Protaetiibacter larvae]|uniref:Alpha/beta hydrolase n=1 Tax=Protaetiibacter larvae TaxID=2592654 RepID=A0A5C1Y6K3_9MICO|nr:alpha/beta hydrolase [Protaetiibacter larvae]QEO09673.1 alpha/beta hydrolase [Protaetiibacter larvae]